MPEKDVVKVAFASASLDLKSSIMDSGIFVVFSTDGGAHLQFYLNPVAAAVLSNSLTPCLLALQEKCKAEVERLEGSIDAIRIPDSPEGLEDLEGQ